MPIKRWHGWGAQCRQCGQFIDLTGDGVMAWQDKDQVKESLDLQQGDAVEWLITLACRCQQERTHAQA